jgi:hypothetical protein
MIRLVLSLLLIGLASACAEEPAVKNAETAVKKIDEDRVKAKQLSIEAAAEEATKIIEADANDDAPGSASMN